ncbi:MAG: hypothetical protein HYZ83_02755 [Candidatus Omnitrophica bacterium]|nr:hypothetical protein [Candidatus Omnitrophota bacterium]
MPAEFKIFQIQNQLQPDHEKIRDAVKQALENFFDSGLMPLTSPYPYDSEDHLFFQIKEGILWARILYEPLSHALLENLSEEYESLLKNAKGKILGCIFFPSLGRGVGEVFRSVALRKRRLGMNVFASRFFEYCFLSSQGEEGLALKELHRYAEDSQRLSGLPLSFSDEKIPEEYHFFKHARLSSLELEALIDIGHQLKSH